MCASMFMYYGTCVEVRRQLAEFSSLLSSCGSQELSLGHQIWWWVPLPAEPSPYPRFSVFVFKGVYYSMAQSL